jgi:hypothetical protein
VYYENNGTESYNKTEATERYAEGIVLLADGNYFLLDLSTITCLPHAAKPQRQTVKVTRQQEPGSRHQVSGFPNPIVDIALSPWPTVFGRYHVSGTNICAHNAVVANKDSQRRMGGFRCHDADLR